jgi:prepilin-type N-terminal cleavage/methylation domain-containing protein/prepilin-type processing-associated H-X9-DG protein
MQNRRLGMVAFTLIELLVVIAIIALLVAMMVPTLGRAKHLAGEKVCAANLRGANIAMILYAQEHRDVYPLEPTEHNPHLSLVEALIRYDGGIVEAMYCTQAPFLETFAADPQYVPRGDTDSVVNTPANRKAGNLSYVYWSFRANKYCPEAVGSENKKHWRNPTYFLPRQLTLDGIEARRDWLGPTTQPENQDERYQECLDAPAHQTWVMSDFFRRGAPFPHARSHARGLNVGYLDSHVELITGKPRNNYR